MSLAHTASTRAYALLAAVFTLVEVNTFRAGQFRKAQGIKAKTDQIDARCVVAILSLGDHKPLCTPEPVFDNMKELTRFRTDLVNEKSMAIIHLREALSIMFPEYDKVFRLLDPEASLALLAVCPGPEPLSRLVRSEYIRCCRQPVLTELRVGPK